MAARVPQHFSAIVLSRAATGWLFSKNLTDKIAGKLPKYPTFDQIGLAAAVILFCLRMILPSQSSRDGQGLAAARPMALTMPDLEARSS
jgi:hypothetical protein